MWKCKYLQNVKSIEPTTNNNKNAKKPSYNLKRSNRISTSIREYVKLYVLKVHLHTHSTHVRNTKIYLGPNDQEIDWKYVFCLASAVHVCRMQLFLLHFTSFTYFIRDFGRACWGGGGKRKGWSWRPARGRGFLLMFSVCELEHKIRNNYMAIQWMANSNSTALIAQSHS